MSNASDFVIENGVLVEYSGSDENVVIPDGVTEIRRFAFYFRQSLASIIIPNSVTKIENKAFSCCKNLEKLTFLGEIKSISDKAFSGCPLNIMIAPAVPTEIFKKASLMPIASIGFLTHRELFTNADVAKEYEKYILSQRKRLLPEIFKHDMADVISFFAEKGKITVVNFEEEFLFPAQKAQATECIAYLLDWKNKNITLEQEEKQIEREFNKDPLNAADMKKLWSYEKFNDGSLVITGYKDNSTEVIIPWRIGKDTVVAIAVEAFSPEKKGRLSKQAEVLKKIRSITIPDGVTKIGGSAFRSCESLQSVTIPNSMTVIGGSAFCYCEKLADITIPDSVTKIGDLAFNDCPNLTIHAPAGSFAEEYAKENKIRFKAI